MSDASDKAFAYIVGVEGALSMDPNDPGNWTGGRVGVGELRGTKFGVSAAAHPTLDIANLQLASAQGLFVTEYWDKIHGDELPYPIALCGADDAYNHGVHTAICSLQKALGLTVDGDMGPKTIEVACKGNLAWIVKSFQAERALAYARDPNEAKFGLDWFRERVIGTAVEALKS